MSDCVVNTLCMNSGLANLSREALTLHKFEIDAADETDEMMSSVKFTKSSPVPGDQRPPAPLS